MTNFFYIFVDKLLMLHHIFIIMNLKKSLIYIFYLSLIVLLFSCIATAKFVSGEQAFERKYYFVASQLLEKEIEKTKNPNTLFDKLFLLGESYRMMNKPQEAIKWYKKSLDIKVETVLYFKIADQLKKLDRYDEALIILNELKNKKGNSAHLQRELSICKQAKYWFEHPDTGIIVSELDINTPYSEFASDFYLDDYLVISSDRRNVSNLKYGWTGRYFYNLYIVDKKDLIDVENFSNFINEKYNDASACFTEDNRQMFFVRCGGEQKEINTCQIYYSNDYAGYWSKPVLLPFEKPGINYVSPYIDDKGKILYFSSDENSEENGFDIYYSLYSNDKWSVPVKLPAYINTPGNEKFITGWKDELYFSSDFLPGLGGLDIFKTGLDEQGRFLPPEHLAYPFNSGGDDFYLLKDSDSTGVFSSSRIGGKGDDDIYSFSVVSTFEKSMKYDSTGEKNIKKPVHKKIFLALKVLENVYSEKDNPNSKILGKRALKKVTVSFGKGKNVKLDNGILIKEIMFDTAYHIVAGKKGYLSKSRDLIIKPEKEFLKKSNTINLNIELEKIYVGKEIILRDIYYDYNKWDIRQDAVPTLNRLFNILKNNPAFKIRIGSHTDCRGDEDYNLLLSQRRAESVVNYLINKGIDRNRLEAIGYGETKLIEKCPCEECTEDQHQMNRRTTFELLHDE